MLLSPTSIGTPIYSQPANPSGLVTMSDFDPSIAWGNHYQFAADDFVLPRTASITEVRWWGIYQKGKPVETIQPPVSDTLPESNFTIRIFNDNAGVPGTVESESNALGNCNRTPINHLFGNGEQYQYFEYHYQFSEPFEALAGHTYWLFIADSTGSFPDDIFFSWLKSKISYWCYSFEPGGLTGWTPYTGSDGLAFELYVPPVQFNDPNLKAAVEQKLGILNPTPEDMLSLEVLFADNLGIGDLTGLEYAVNLKQLRLYGNNIVDISPLHTLVNLERLVLAGNEIVDVSPLSGMSQLTDLALDMNRIHDISPLVTLTSLKILNLAWNDHITDIEVVALLPNLTFINFDGSPIGDYETNMDILASLTQLEHLGVADCNISDLDFLSGLLNLKYLALFNNSLTDISLIANLTELETLRLNINELTDLSALTDLHHLVSLEIQDNPLSSEAYCQQIPQIIRNNPDINLLMDPNPYFPDYAGDLWGTECGVDMEDFMLLVSYWLEDLPTNQMKLDLAPQTGDGRIDILDFAVLADDWMKQM
jgi:hypothetical protein